MIGFFFNCIYAQLINTFYSIQLSTITAWRFFFALWIWIFLIFLQGESSCYKTIEVNQWQNIGEVLDKYKIFPKNKAMMSIPFCQLLSMLIVRPTLKTDVLKMEQVSFIGYCEGETTLYVSSTNLKGEEELVSKYIPSWSSLWTRKNAKFEKFLLEYLDRY